MNQTIVVHACFYLNIMNDVNLHSWKITQYFTCFLEGFRQNDYNIVFSLVFD